MTDLIKYDAACRAIAEAKSVDEVKGIRDVAVAMKAYARQAKNKDMEADAAEIRMRATRRLDQMVKAQAATVGLATGGQPYQATGLSKNPVAKPTLAEQGVDKNLAHESRKLGAMSDAEFEGAVADVRRTVTNAIKTVVAQKTKKADRDGREQALGQRIRSEAERLGSMPKFGVILADPSWKFEPWSIESGMDRAADNHYPTTPTDALASLQPPSADAAVLLLWATAPMLPDALFVMTAWGFDYKSHLCWDKVDIGTGYWFRGQHELLLVGTKGDFPAPAEGTQMRSVLTQKSTEHSAKPADIADWIDKVFPSLPKLEMFARSGRPGWESWGAEAPHESDDKKLRRIDPNTGPNEPGREDRSAA